MCLQCGVLEILKLSLIENQSSVWFCCDKIDGLVQDCGLSIADETSPKIIVCFPLNE